MFLAIIEYRDGKEFVKKEFEIFEEAENFLIEQAIKLSTGWQERFYITPTGKSKKLMLDEDFKKRIKRSQTEIMTLSSELEKYSNYEIFLSPLWEVYEDNIFLKFAIERDEYINGPSHSYRHVERIDEFDLFVEALNKFNEFGLQDLKKGD